MTVEIISVGTEILMGNIVNTNAAFLSEQCVTLGLSCYNQQVVGDNHDRLADAFKLALSRADIVLVSGGLGPTEDDLTKETAAEVCGSKLVEHKPSMDALKAYFAKRNIPLTENNYKQAYMPEDGKVLENPNGTAPGVIIPYKAGSSAGGAGTAGGTAEKAAKKYIILMPGPPGEMKPMFLSSVRPFLKKRSPGTIYSVTVKETGIGESSAEELIKDLIDTQTNPTIATYAKTGEVHMRVSAMAENKAEARKLTAPVVKEIKKRFGKHVYTTDENVTLEEAVVKLLKKRGLTITFAESCTGGLLSGRVVGVPGVSDVYKTGFVTYSNKAKHKLLGVSKKTLKKFGAVSEECAYEMAFGAAKAAEADVAVAITGIAGPDGGTEEKPVGTVYIGCCINGEASVKRFNFSGNREKIRDNSVSAALRMLHSELA
ncbi:MAG: competence/damage-inducible protein A [Lachnospiraceae bacterium]|nr:competence/damage-inducible protein A [Lachnospiraceae bacterium]